ncbi:hypothetical protein ACE1TI_18515 [Alteribacillus sp. JSM 102045]|uniref:hypothetical protein n=1 Tax=Alteribacillus sp. JSM 102045 TaxID=1562101 RepID=UPI0035C0F2F6
MWNGMWNSMLKWVPYKEQSMCERKLAKVMKRLKIENYNFNWDRVSCVVEFRYKEKSYKMEHSVQKAKQKGIILRNGLDCLNEMIETLDDLCEIIDRGTFKLETWIAGMNQSPSEEEVPEYEEEFHIRYKSLAKQNHSENDRNEFVPVASESSLRNFDRSHILHRAQRK